MKIIQSGGWKASLLEFSLCCISWVESADKATAVLSSADSQEIEDNCADSSEMTDSTEIDLGAGSASGWSESGGKNSILIPEISIFLEEHRVDIRSW
ncbi:MAG: hypothetical protein K2M98_05765 [Muribaculum sp.]|nr:hypothetical protein [Muribaculum sp.]